MFSCKCKKIVPNNFSNNISKLGNISSSNENEITHKEEI